MKFLLLSLVLLAAVYAAPKRGKREAYALPDGSDILVGPVKTTFNCFYDGYYADVENECQIFHVCHTVEREDGARSIQQWSFLCGNQTIFNQLTLSCTDPEDSVPCSEAINFYNINDRINAENPEINFLDEEDIQRAALLLFKNTRDDGNQES